MTAFGRSAAATLWLLLIPASAPAQDDHLKCYKIRDPQPKATYTADLGGLTPEPGCVIKVPARMACVPSTKTNVQPPPPGGGGSGTPNAFACYKVKCPRSTLPPIALNDQFGSRSATPTAPKMLCAPVAPVATTTTTIVSTTTTTTLFPPCTGGTGFPVCDGTCPGGSACGSNTTSGNGECVCFSDTLPCDQTGTACNGTCPAGQACGSLGTDVCACLPVGTTGCGDSSYPTCGGFCPSGSCMPEKLVVAGGPTATRCACGDPAAACQFQSGPGVCGGLACPSGQMCEIDLTGPGSATGCSCGSP